MGLGSDQQRTTTCSQWVMSRTATGGAAALSPTRSQWPTIPVVVSHSASLFPPLLPLCPSLFSTLLLRQCSAIAAVEWECDERTRPVTGSGASLHTRTRVERSTAAAATASSSVQTRVRRQSREVQCRWNAAASPRTTARALHRTARRPLGSAAAPLSKRSARRSATLRVSATRTALHSFTHLLTHSLSC